MINQLKIQNLLRKTKDKFISVSKTAQILGIKENQAIEILAYLESKGYLEKAFNELWLHSLRGKILANKKLDKIFKIETLKEQLKNLIKRLHTVNLSEEYPYYINCAMIISEYPFTQDSNGINIVYSLLPKELNERKRKIVKNELRKRHQGSFDNTVQSVFYPKEAIKLFLKSKSPVLKLSQHKDEEIQTINGHKIFQFSTGTTENPSI